MAKTCGECVHYYEDRKSHLADRGQCRYNPPVPVVVVNRNKDQPNQPETKPISVFPFVNAKSDWCSRFQGKNKADSTVR